MTATIADGTRAGMIVIPGSAGTATVETATEIEIETIVGQIATTTTTAGDKAISALARYGASEK
jgi:hypothetical protein